MFEMGTTLLAVGFDTFQVVSMALGQVHSQDIPSVCNGVLKVVSSDSGWRARDHD